MSKVMRSLVLSGLAVIAVPGAVFAQGVQGAAVEPPAAEGPVPVVTPAQKQQQTFEGVFGPVVQPIPVLTDEYGNPLEAVQSWTLGDAQALLGLLQTVGSEGLEPADYNLPTLSAAIAGGEGSELDEAASQSYSWLIEDLRDGRTPMEARKQWFIVDPDPDAMPTVKVMADALASHDIAGVVEMLTPDHPDYVALKQALAETPVTEKKRIAMIRANMDRWRWLGRVFGKQYLMTNVPEYQLRLTVNHKILRTYRTVVGKPGKTATPQLAEIVEGVVFNPTWTVPQSIVKGEGLGQRALANPGWARAQGYKATRGANGYVSVVQQPGPTNSLGIVKLDMPNPHAIFLHDTPSKGLFDTENRAYSHGCIRTERALELGITLAILGGITKEEAVAISLSREYNKVALGKTMPVYITYFTMGRDINGELRTFSDIYGRDAPVLASLSQPRVANRARATSEEVIPIEAPGA
jgi:murein L,D-transpeptidase YcbB/YkuD